MTRPATTFAIGLSVLAVVLTGPRGATGAPRNAFWTHLAGVYNGVWEQTTHWTPYYIVPENGTHQWYVQFNLKAHDYYVEVSDSHTVTSIGANSDAGYLVELTNWTGARLWLQFDTFENIGGLDVNNIDLYGPITNRGEWTVRGGMVNYLSLIHISEPTRPY